MSAILTLNAGFSSIKFGVYLVADGLPKKIGGQVENLGPNAELEIGETETPIGQADHETAVEVILKAIEPWLEGERVQAVGHRIVHGGSYFSAPTLIDDAVLERLVTLFPLAPMHEPNNIAAVRAARVNFPDAMQVGCFDTAFHAQQNFVQAAYGLPRRYYDQGIRRYGFHGLSYRFIASVLRKDHPDLHAGRVIVAHLGNGASMCAMRAGQSIGCSMGFSALDGLPMGTRSGQIDPGVLLHLMGQGQGLEDLTRLLYEESGLKGLSGLTHDMRALLASDDPQAQEALSYYVFRNQREIGAMAAMLGGVDALVFTGGVGENAAPIRERIVDGLGFLGLATDAAANARGDRMIGAGDVPVMVIPTDEQRVIARSAEEWLHKHAN